MEQKEMKYPSVHSPKIWHGPSSFLAGKAAMPYKDAHCSALAAWILSSIRSKKGSRPRFPFSRWKTWELKASNGLTILFRISLHNYTTRRSEQLKCTIPTMGLYPFWSMNLIFMIIRFWFKNWYKLLHFSKLSYFHKCCLLWR